MAEEKPKKEPETFAEYIAQFPTVVNIGSPVDPHTGELVNDIQKGPLQLSTAAITTRAMNAYLKKMEQKRRDEEGSDEPAS